ncbi:hypothetical protein DCE79_14875 [Lysinibacillus sp. 2017]|uniref:tetratricopeptide repeat protein n=1 Tax=unclassified Lysinibacillus TaxID=2636778 RepID=UPI000D529D1E|nr:MULTISPECIES: hypothetical protein [unclassified Lysinibacillus]AWE08573.1 hypothetical protein DCE79_14875 [Lysinibacillus sp. 2017]TGN35663.1 tetratricopeptide repeat protein [Lysinibacillus sp. S2017]
MAGKQINPKLIQALTNKTSNDIPTSPTFKHLGGTYVKSIVDQIKKIGTPYEKNEMMMTCKHCGQSGKYNIGILAIDISDKGQNNSQQLTGYFRCKHCNTGGQWEDSSELYFLGISALLAPDEDLPVHFGEIQLFDGTSPKYATDGEEHLLRLISTSPKSGFLWNKLGNLYLTGSRPELAMAAFEKSIELDPNQIESHLSIANLLMSIRDYQQAIHHLHHMMIAAHTYTCVEATYLRELLSHGICTSFIAATESKNKYPALPTQQQLIAAGSTIDLESEGLPAWLELSSEDITSFYSLAELFMGERALELKETIQEKKPQQKSTKSQQVQAFIDAQQSLFTKADIQNACPNVSAATITRVVNELRKNDVIEMVGHGRNTQWRKRVE